MSSTNAACAIKNNGSLWCWGADTNGQLGNGSGTTADQISPSAVTSTLPWSQITSGATHSCGIKNDGTGWCWGAGGNGQLGNNASSSQTAPVQIYGPLIWASLGAGGNMTCGIASDRSGWCWGSDSNGTLGNGTVLTADLNAPSKINSDGGWMQISPSDNYACGIKLDGTAWCWGDAGNGRLGNGLTGGTFASPIKVLDPGPWIYIDTGANSTCGLKADGSAWCWGESNQGQIGNAATSGIYSLPVPVLGGGPWMSLSVGNTSVCGMKQDKSVWCWGIDSNGQLGNGPTLTANQYVPSQVKTVPLRSGWSLNEGGTSFSPLAGLSSIIGTTRWLSFDGNGAYGFNLQGSGLSRIKQTAAANHTIIEANGTGNAAQLSMSAAGAKVSSDVTTGLISKYSLDASAGATATDSVGGFNATLTGSPTWLPTSGRVAGALQFTGTQRGTVTRNATLEPAAITISLWARRDGMPSGYSELILKDRNNNGGPAYNSYGLGVTNDPLSPCPNFRVCFWSGHASNVQDTLSSNAPIPTGQWYYITATYDPASPPPQKKIYINGVLDNASILSSALAYDTTASGNLFIGTDTATNTQPWIGLLDDIRIYNRALDPAEVAQLYYYTGQDAVTRSMGVSFATNNYVFARNDAAVGSWLSALQPDMEIAANGDVGIGTTGGMNAKVDVNGGVKVGSDGGSCTAAKAGTIQWTGTVMQYCDGGGAWKTMTTSTVSTASTLWDSGLYSSAPGENNNCAIRSDGTMWCNGYEGHGQLGNGNLGNTFQMSPTLVQTDTGPGGWSDWIALDTCPQYPDNSTCGIRTDGTMWCFGGALFGKLGDNQNTTDRTRPVKVHTDVSSAGWSDWIAVTAAAKHTCGIRSNGTLWCWGHAGEGRLGNNDASTEHDRPVQVLTDTGVGSWSDWTQVNAFYHTTCGIRSNGTAWCWGSGYTGQIGNGALPNSQLVPAQVQTDTGPGAWSDWVKISAGNTNVCGIRTNGTLWCWGAKGACCDLGDGGTTNVASRPIQVQTDTGPGAWSDWTQISAAYEGACGIRVDGSAWCWGNEAYGKLGIGTAGSRSRPAQVQTDTGPGGWYDWVQINSGGSLSCGVRANGTRWCWGRSAEGRLGDGQMTTDRYRPVQVP
jgi:alpha-tubulin suppressor-like RCC1 family protein